MLAKRTASVLSTRVTAEWAGIYWLRSSPSELKLFGQLEAKHPKDAVFTLGRRLFPLTRWLNNTANTSGTGR